MPNLIEIINPKLQSGTKPEHVSRRKGDIITVPITHRRGVFPLIQGLNLRSVEALWIVHKNLV